MKAMAAAWSRVIELVEAMAPYPQGMYQPLDHPYFRDWGVTEPCSERLQTILDCLGDVRGKSVLDIGCCFGYFSHHLARLGARVVGVDVDEPSIEICRLLSYVCGLPSSNPEFHWQSYQHYLAGSGRRFDAVLFLSVFHHELREDTEAAWRSLDLVSRHTDLLLIDLCEDTAGRHVPGWRPELMLKHTAFTELAPLRASRRPRMMYAVRRGDGSPL